MLDIYVDADGSPVKDEVFRVARRYSLRVFLVANTVIQGSPSDRWESIVVRGGPDEADHWIAEHVEKDDIVVTADIPLADRSLSKGARALGPTGKPFTDKNIGGALASRELSKELRQMGMITGGPRPMRKEDRSRFLSSLDALVQSIRRTSPRREDPTGP